MVVRPRSRRCKSDLSSCQDCAAILSDANWTPSMQRYKRYICATCWTARQRKYEEKRKERNPDHLLNRRAKVLARQAAWSDDRKKKEQRRRYGAWLLRNYGISIEDYDKLYESQGGRCRICGTSRPRGRGGFHVDHCHESGAVRGLLCASCNLMLGLVKDSKETLMKAIEYLMASNDNHKPEARAAAGGKAY